MERLKAMKECLMSCAQGQMSHLDTVDAKELGEVVDMIKDLEEAMYYCSIVKSMEKREKEEKEHEGKQREHHHYYTEKYIPFPPEIYYDEGWRDLDREMGRMYYQGRDSEGRFTSGRGGNRGGRRGYPDRIYYGGGNGNDSSSGGSNGSSGNGGGNSGGSYGFEEREYPMEMRDYREGSSPIRRKYYMEAKEQHQDKKAQMEELEKYMKELSKDITEMIQDASPEETQLLKQKLVTLSEKIK